MFYTLGQPWHVGLTTTGTVRGGYNMLRLTCLVSVLHLNTKRELSNYYLRFLSTETRFENHYKGVSKTNLGQFFNVFFFFGIS